MVPVLRRAVRCGIEVWRAVVWAMEGAAPRCIVLWRCDESWRVAWCGLLQCVVCGDNVMCVAPVWFVCCTVWYGGYGDACRVVVAV